jgi:hypothetical protein
MIDPIEDILAPTVVERTMGIYASFGDRDHSDIVQTRRALTRYIFTLIGGGLTNDERLTVAGLIYLKQLERDRRAAGRRPCKS